MSCRFLSNIHIPYTIHTYTQTLRLTFAQERAVRECMRACVCLLKCGMSEEIYLFCVCVAHYCWLRNPGKFKEIAKNENLSLSGNGKVHTRSMMCECDVLIEITIRNGNEL